MHLFEKKFKKYINEEEDVWDLVPYDKISWDLIDDKEKEQDIDLDDRFSIMYRYYDTTFPSYFDDEDNGDGGFWQASIYDKENEEEIGVLYTDGSIESLI